MPTSDRLRRPTSTGHRARQAAETRRRITMAAASLFAEQGYVATTVPQIAAAAGVAVPTVYWSFGSKRAVVAAIRSAWLDDAAHDSHLDDVLSAGSAGDRVAALARFLRLNWDAGGDAVALLEDARRTETTMAGDVRAIEVARAARVSRVIGTLVDDLRSGCTARAATDATLALASLEGYRMLRARGWTSDDYEAWLARHLAAELLGSSPAPGTPR